MIRRFTSYVENNSPADNPCDACGKKGHRHVLSIFSGGLTGQHFLMYFCDHCMAKDSTVFKTIAQKFFEKAEELAGKGY